MKFLVFEWLTGGGLYFDGIQPDEQGIFLRQGTAMLEALVEDLNRANHELIIPVDDRLDLQLPAAAALRTITRSTDLRSAMQSLAEKCDHVLLIAPEIDGCLANCCDWLSDFSKQFISPNSGFVQLTSCKQTTADWLAAAGVRVPQGMPVVNQHDLERFSFPFVVKPLIGAGSEEVHYVDGSNALVRLDKAIQHLASHAETRKPRYRVESFASGTPVSVSVLSGPDDYELLPATGQSFDHQPIGAHVGAEWPLPENTAQRARKLAAQTVDALPKPRGYFGIDMVISDKHPRADTVIEVNPRLTTSYLKLREILRGNLAERMVQIALGSAG